MVIDLEPYPGMLATVHYKLSVERDIQMSFQSQLSNIKIISSSTTGKMKTNNWTSRRATPLNFLEMLTEFQSI